MAPTHGPEYGHIRPTTDADRVLGQIERGEIRCGPDVAREIAARHQAAYGDVWDRRDQHRPGGDVTTHLVIATDGVIEHCTTDVRADPLGTYIDAAVGPEGHDRVRLHPGHAVAAFVNDTGLFNPEKYPRNVVGSCLLVVLGARPRPYAGPVVLTGWDASMLLGYPTEIVPLGPTNVHVLADIHTQILAALAHKDVRPDYPHEWAASVREVAEHVRTAPTPQVTFTTVEGPR